MSKVVFVFFILLAVAWIVLPLTANACKPCGQDPIAYSSQNAGLIFIGTLKEPIKVKQPVFEDYRNIPEMNFTYEVEIKKILKGKWSKETIQIAEGTDPKNPCSGGEVFIPSYSKDYIFFSSGFSTDKESNIISLQEYCGRPAIELHNGRLARVEKGYNRDIKLQTYDFITLEEFERTYLED